MPSAGCFGCNQRTTTTATTKAAWSAHTQPHSPTPGFGFQYHFCRFRGCGSGTNTILPIFFHSFCCRRLFNFWTLFAHAISSLETPLGNIADGSLINRTDLREDTGAVVVDNGADFRLLLPTAAVAVTDTNPDINPEVSKHSGALVVDFRTDFRLLLPTAAVAGVTSVAKPTELNVVTERWNWNVIGRLDWATSLTI